MNELFLYVLLAVVVGFVSEPAEKITDLSEYRWKNRLVFLFAPSETDSAYQRMKDQIQELQPDLDERDVVLFRIFENGKSRVDDSLLGKSAADALRKKYDIKTGALTLVLVGKDGSEKLRQKGDIDFQTVFDRIDAMPMRQREMRQRK